MIRVVTFLIFIAMLLATCRLFAQNNDQAGDMNAKPGPASPTDSTWMVDNTRFSIGDFVKGYIITSSNLTLAGLLKFNGSVVIFKDTVTQKTKRYGAEELKGFIAKMDTSKTYQAGHSIPVDTFKVCADSFEVQGRTGHAGIEQKTVHNAKFLKLMIYGEKVCLYKTTVTQSQGTFTPGVFYYYLNNIFYFKRKNETTYTKVPEGKRAFKKMMTDYFKDNPELVKAIINGDYNYEEIDEITKTYNQN